jgi:hypothetical protein
MLRCRLVPALLGLMSFGTGCPPDPGPRAPVDFVFPDTRARQSFLATPFPSDLLILDDGRLDLRTFPNPFGSTTLEDFLAIFETAPAWAATTTMYFRVEGGVDESTLPQTPLASVADDSGLFVVELSGPRAGRRLPIEWRHYPEGTAFLPPGTVAVSLLLGAVPEGRFALVATSTLRHADGTRLGPSRDFERLLACDLPDLDRNVDCAPYQALPQTLGVAADDIAVAAVITPRDSSAGLVKAAAKARAFVPTIRDVVHNADGSNAHFDRYDGVITLAQYQAGRPPYDSYDGESGGFVLGDDGAPVQQRTEDVPFVLTVPKGPMPAAGWCVVINGHGTGGDLESGVGTRAGDESFRLKEAGCAMMAISEPLHRTREGHREGQEETLTFNFFNPLAGRDNWRQSALEKVQQVTALSTLSFTGVGGATVRMDPDQIGYFGHSQGGIVGGLLIAVEPRLTGALLSGAGAGFAPSLIEKTDPVVIADVLKLVLQIPDDEPIDTFHPVPALLQTFVDDADPLNYGALWRRTPGAPHLLATSGLTDTFTPPRNHAGLAGAFRLPLATPVAEPLEILEVLGIDAVASPVSGNLVDAGADDEVRTAALVQYPRDGHFAIFTNPAAHQLFTHFFQTLREDGVPTIRTSGD